MQSTKQEQPVTRLDQNFRWPGGKRIAIVFNIAYEAWSDGQAPGIGPMGNVLRPGFFDTNADSWATFGPVRGIGRLLDIADRHGIKTSVMVNGVLAQRYPETVRDIHRRGHEIVAHSWGMDVIPVYLNEDEERANVVRTQTAITEYTGARSVGWISPRGTGSLISPSILAGSGFEWYGDCNDDELPYVVETAGGRIVAIPLTMEVNDLPHSVRYGNPPRAMVELFDDTLKAMRERERGPIMLDVTAHTHCFGRAFGAWAYEAIIERVKHQDDLWIPTRLEMARHVLETVR